MAKVEEKPGDLSQLLQSTSSIGDQVTAASLDDTNAEEEEEKPKNVYLPINTVARIFSFLTPDELETARLVCRTWNNVIERHRDSLPYRKISVLHLSTNCEFVFALICDNKMAKYVCQKYWSDFDYEMREKFRVFEAKEPFKYHFKCNKRLNNESAWTEHHIDSRMHLNHCTIRTSFVDPTPLISCAIYNTAKRDFYAKQLFTPPLIYYEKLRDMTKYTDIDTIVFNHFSVNETTGDMLKRWSGPFYVRRCIFHNLNLRAVSPKEFRVLVTEAIVADEYYFAYVHKALPNHFNADLFFHPTILRAKKLCIGAIFDRTQMKGMVRCNFSEEDLHKFIYRSEPGSLDAFKFNWDNFNHSAALLNKAQTSVFKTLQSKRDMAI